MQKSGEPERENEERQILSSSLRSDFVWLSRDPLLVDVRWITDCFSSSSSHRVTAEKNLPSPYSSSYACHACWVVSSFFSLNEERPVCVSLCNTIWFPSENRSLFVSFLVFLPSLCSQCFGKERWRSVEGSAAVFSFFLVRLEDFSKICQLSLPVFLSLISHKN